MGGPSVGIKFQDETINLKALYQIIKSVLGAKIRFYTDPATGI
jgi:hypothetical protein